jgi:hypothetical protein
MRIEPIAPQGFDAAMRFSEARSAAPETASYPLFADPSQRRRALARAQENGLLLGAYDRDALVGVLALRREAGGRYLESDGAFADSPDVYGAFLSSLPAAFDGYEIIFGFPKANVSACDIMAARGEVCDSATVTLLGRERFPAAAETRCVRIDGGNYAPFAAFHDSHEPDMYWNSSRLRANLSDWLVYAVKNGEDIFGSVTMNIADRRRGEIFSLTCAAEEGAGALLTAVGAAYFDLPNGREILFFIDDRQPCHLTAALSLGFAVVGGYKSYKIQLKNANAHPAPERRSSDA